MSSIDPRHLVTASRSDLGRKRRENQDACVELAHASGARLLFVADGMGGHRGGSTASRLAVEAVGEVFAKAAEEPEALLRRAFAAANERIHRRSLADARLAGMGTTGVALLFAPDGSLFVAHVGDSRAYRMRGETLAPLTVDHSLVAELVSLGVLAADETAEYPGRNAILRALGTHADVEVDVARVDVAPGDRFLLCSDGLTAVARDEEIARIVAGARPERAVARLVDLANDRGGPDNVTVQVVEVPDEAAAAGASAGPAAVRGARPGPFLGPLLVAVGLAATLVLARFVCAGA